MEKTMATRPQILRPISPAQTDPIRIVPLHFPSPRITAAPTAAPQLTYRSGPLLTAVEVFTVFWGTDWNAAPMNALMRDLNVFFDEILNGVLMDQLAEYSVPGQTIGHGRHTGSTVLVAPALGASVTDRTIQHVLEQEISTNSAFPQPNANTLYFLYVPPNVRVVQGGSASCQAFCGYHNDINGQIFYAVMPYPGCSGCTGGLQQFDALTSTSSHELCEAITDPIPGKGWYDDVHGEIGDICAWKTKKINNYVVQLEWSNAENKCL